MFEGFISLEFNRVALIRDQIARSLYGLVNLPLLYLITDDTQYASNLGVEKRAKFSDV